MRTLAACLLATVGLISSAWGQSDELLPAEQAFAFSAQASSPDTIQVRWDIADGYYMYRDKFDTRVVAGTVTLGAPSMPQGKKKSDQYFGEQEVYTGQVEFEIPVARAHIDGPLDLSIESFGQGCNEPVGVCYPPLKQSAEIQLAALSRPASSPVTDLQQTEVTSLDSLRQLLGGDQQPEFLKPDEAFRLDLFAKGPDTLSARIEIAPGYYLYRDKFDFESQTDGVSLGEFELPAGVEKEDEYFGKTITYYDGVEISVPIRRTGQEPRASFQVTYQGCAEKGICYPPIKKNIVVDLLPVSTVQASQYAEGSPLQKPVQGFWGYVVAAFGVGLLLTFTPCVLPLVPIMSSFIVGQGGTEKRGRGGLLSLTYVLGTALTYTAAGVVAGASGEQLQAYFQNIWFIGFVCVVLIGLAMSMFGLYEIQMPGAMQARLQDRSQNLGGGTVVMVFALGVVSALIVGACVSPLLIGALGVAIMKGDPVLGGAIMFSMALGMGVFLVLIGVGLGTLLPRAGPWMDYVKHFFGVVLVGTAIYLLGTIAWVPVLYLWSLLFIVTAVYCGALQAIPEQASGWRYFWKGIGIVLLVWGVLCLLGGMSGSRDVLRPVDVSSWGRSSAVNTAYADFVRIRDLGELDQQLASAKAGGKPVLLDYYADWCVDCIRMEKATFSDEAVSRRLENFVLVQVDVTDPDDEEASAVKKRYGVYGPPAMLFFDGTGEERTAMRRYGFMSADEFLEHIAGI